MNLNIEIPDEKVHDILTNQIDKLSDEDAYNIVKSGLEKLFSESNLVKETFFIKSGYYGNGELRLSDVGRDFFSKLDGSAYVEDLSNFAVMYLKTHFKDELMRALIMAFTQFLSNNLFKSIDFMSELRNNGTSLFNEMYEMRKNNNC